MQDTPLYKFLTTLPDTQFPDETTFLTTVVPEFISILGYDESQLFFEADIWMGSIRKRVDSLIASSRGSRPWLVIETKLNRKRLSTLPFEWLESLKVYQSATLSEFGVLLSPELLVVTQLTTPREFSIRDYWLRRLSVGWSNEIQFLLARPEQLPTESLPFPKSPSKVIDTETYKIDLHIYSQLLETVFTAETNDEKKRSLETLARYLFEAIKVLSCKYIDLRTRSSEIDIIVEYRGADRLTIFDEFGRYLLVECKNWKESVGAAQVRDFIGKLRKCRTTLGIILAKNGISGELNGAEAVLEIHTAFHADGIYVVVISEEDLRAVARGDNFYDILDKKIDNLRFDI